MRRTLIDDKLEEQFQKDGYVTIPFLSKEEVEELKAYFFESIKDKGGNVGPEDESFDTDTNITYDFTFLAKNIDHKREVFNKITEAFKQRYSGYLDGYKPIIANFIRKQDDGGEVPMHLNWAFIDEHKCASVSIWCPLVDSNKENGALEVVPGSHKRFGEVRGPMIKMELADIDKEIVEKHMVPMSIEAGTAVILDDSIVHYSSPNNTNDLRLAIQLILIPEEETPIHFHMNLAKDRELVETLEVDQDFFMRFNPWKLPSGNIKQVDSFKYKPFSLTLEEFEQKLREPRFDEVKQTKPSFWKRLAGSK